MTQFVQWLDLLWLPLGFFTVRRDQRLCVLTGFAACMIMMRLVVELSGGMGHVFGYFHVISASPETRALAVYSIFYTIFLALALFSPYAKGVILMGSAITVFFLAFIVALFVMVL